MIKSTRKSEKIKRTKRKTKKIQKRSLYLLLHHLIWIWTISVFAVLTYPTIRNYLLVQIIYNHLPSGLKELTQIDGININVWIPCLIIDRLMVTNPPHFIPDYLIKLENVKIKPTLSREHSKFTIALYISCEKLNLNIYRIPEYGTNIAYLRKLIREKETYLNPRILFSEVSFLKGEVSFSQSIEPISIPIDNQDENKQITTNRYAWTKSFIVELNTSSYSKIIEKIVDYSIIKNPNIPEEPRTKLAEDFLLDKDIDINKKGLRRNGESRAN